MQNGVGVMHRNRLGAPTYFHFMLRMLGSVVSSRIEVKFYRIVSEVNTQRLTESDFGYDVILSRWRLWRHFAKSLKPAACDAFGSLYALQYL